jgi:glycosyltransferase involved in cell wall biosynthesis
MTTAFQRESVAPQLGERRPLRVLLVTEAAGGGVGRHFLDLAEGLFARGVQVQGVYSTARMDALFRERLASCVLPPLTTLEMCRSISPRDAVAVPQLVKLARRFGPFDLIHGHSSKGGAIARLAARWMGVPAVYTPHAIVTLDPTLQSWKRTIYGRIECWLARRTAALIAVAEEESEHAASLGIDRAKIHVIPNGIEPAPLLPRSEARRQMNLPQDAIVIGFVGRLSQQKAPEDLIRAFAGFASTQPWVRLAIIGSGPLERSARRLASDLRVDQQVNFLGDRVAQPLMSGFDIFSLPSRYEGMPYVLLEALAAGLPIVVTSVGGATLAVDPNINGYIVPPAAVASLQESLARLVQDEPLRNRFSAASRQRSQQYTRERMTDQTLALYVEVLARQSTRGRFDVPEEHQAWAVPPGCRRNQEQHSSDRFPPVNRAQ